MPPSVSGQGYAATMAVLDHRPFAYCRQFRRQCRTATETWPCLPPCRMQAVAGGQTPTDYYSSIVANVGNDVSNGSAELTCFAVGLDPAPGSAGKRFRCEPGRGSQQHGAVSTRLRRRRRSGHYRQRHALYAYQYEHTNHMSSIRVNPYPMPDLLAALEQLQQQQTNATLELGTGSSINKPSDNPAGAAKLIQLNNVSSQADSFQPASAASAASSPLRTPRSVRWSRCSSGPSAWESREPMGRFLTRIGPPSQPK